ncbi:rod-binding protein [Planctomycetota bacterium]
MNIGGIGSLPVDTVGMSAADLANANEKHGDEVAAHFEGVFMSMMLKEMRATLSDGLFGNEASDTFGALFDMHMGQHLADEGGIGIREMVVAEYQKRSVESNVESNAESNERSQP